MRRTFAVLFAVLALAAGGVAGGERDHDRARAALEAGEVLPLTTILGLSLIQISEPTRPY